MFSQSVNHKHFIAGEPSLSFHCLPSVGSSNFGKTWERCQSLGQVTLLASNMRGIWDTSGAGDSWSLLVVCGQLHCVISALAGRWETQGAMLAGAGASSL